MLSPVPAGRTDVSLRLPPIPHPPPEVLGGGSPFGVAVPMSIANVGPGLDRFGLCLSAPSDTLVYVPGAGAFGLEVAADPEIPRGPSANLAAIAFVELLRRHGRSPTGRLRLRKGFRGGSGIGSSGSSAAAGALCAAAVLGLPFDRASTAEEVVRCAGMAEATAAGAAHLDNVAASVFGGFILIEGLDPLRIERFPVPDDLRLVIAVPSVAVATRSARSVLPERVPRNDAVENVAHAAGLVRALLRGDVEGIGANLEDRLAVPYRSGLVPGFERARAAALGAGAWGATLSGSGPGVFALASPARAEAVRRALFEAFARNGMTSECFVARVGAGAEWIPGAGPR